MSSYIECIYRIIQPDKLYTTATIKLINDVPYRNNITIRLKDDESVIKGQTYIIPVRKLSQSNGDVCVSIYIEFNTPPEKLSELFANCTDLWACDTTNLNTSKLKKTDYMFKECHNIRKFSIYNMNNVENMDGMFMGCAQLDQYCMPEMRTDSAISMQHMFKNTCAAKTVYTLCPKFVTVNVKHMDEMFAGCKCQHIDISYFNTQSLKSCKKMFSGCDNLTDIKMFGDQCIFNDGIVMNEMFANCPRLNMLRIYEFEITNPEVFSDAFTGITQSGRIEYYAPNMLHAKHIKREIARHTYKVWGSTPVTVGLIRNTNIK